MAKTRCFQTSWANLEAKAVTKLEDQILMNLSGASNCELMGEKTLKDQDINGQSVLAVDVKAGSDYSLKVQVTEAETIQVPYSFNQQIEKLKGVIAAAIQVQASQLTVLYEGRELEDDFKVYQYGICINDTLGFNIAA